MPPALPSPSTVPLYRRALLAALTVAVVAAPALATAAPAQAATPAPKRLISGWMPYWSMNAARAGVLANGDLVNIASPFWYRATSATTIAKETGAGNAELVTALHAKGIKVVPTVVDGIAPTALATQMNSPTWRKAHVATLVNLAVANRYDGLDLDYEGIAFGSSKTIRPALRTGFTALVADLSKAMHARGKTVTLAVAPTTADVPGIAASVYDYAALGRSADKVRVMAYDYSWSGGTAGAIAPITWVNRVMTYTKSVMPASKVQMGVPLYGYNWGKPGTKATSVSYAGAIALRNQYKAPRQWNSFAQSPFFTYTDAAKVTHTVHYSDAASTLAKMNLAKSLGINGITVWAFGQEDPAMWSAVRGASANSGAITKPAPRPVITTTKITTRWSRSTVTVGTKTSLLAIGPKTAAGRVARREQYVNGHWYLISTSKLNSIGVHAFRVSTTSKGRKGYRVVLPATRTHKAVYSPTTYLTVR